MKNFVTCLLALNSSVAVGMGALTIQPFSAPPLPAGAPSIPWIETPQDTAWQNSKPIWEGKSNGVSGKVWIGGSREALHFHVVVDAPTQKNENHGKNLWRGDCLYIGLNGRGDHLRDKAPLQADDAVFIFGLGSEGPEAQISAHGDPAQMHRGNGSLIQSIVRDDKTKKTIYDIMIPYDRVSTALGQSLQVGVSVIIAHKDRDGKDLCWGALPGNDGKNAREFNALGLPVPKGTWATVAPIRIRTGSPKEPVEISLAIQSSESGKIEVRLGDQTTLVEVPGKKEIQHWLVTVPYEQITGATADLRIEVEPIGIQETYSLFTPRVAKERLEERIKKLMGTASNNLIRNHLASTLMVVRDAYTRLPLEAAHPRRPWEFMDAVTVILDKLPPEQTDWNDYIHKCIPLVFAFVSESDRSLQFYALQLPYEYREGQSYPLTIYLHGTGDPNPVAGLTTAFDNSGQDTLFRTISIAPDKVPASHQGFVLAPWARGNSMYQSYGADDVYQCIAQVQNGFTIDPDRIYMTGFSMGCHGAIRLAGQRPELFAGVNLASGFGSWSDTELKYLAENLRGIPLALWIGELDPMLEGAHEMDRYLSSQGFEHRLVTVPNLPHTYPYLEYQNNVGYLMQFKRKQLTEFSYTTDTPEHIGRNGVLMAVPMHVNTNALPRFTCHLSGSTVTIHSYNTKGLRVDLGEKGLGCHGDHVTLIWNGKEVYSGAPKRIDLGDLKSDFDR